MIFYINKNIRFNFSFTFWTFDIAVFIYIFRNFFDNFTRKKLNIRFSNFCIHWNNKENMIAVFMPLFLHFR